LGKEFFQKLEPSTVEGSNHYAKLKKYQSTLLKFNVYVDAILEKVGGSFFIKETEMKF